MSVPLGLTLQQWCKSLSAPAVSRYAKTSQCCHPDVAMWHWWPWMYSHQHCAGSRWGGARGHRSLALYWFQVKRIPGRRDLHHWVQILVSGHVAQCRRPHLCTNKMASAEASRTIATLHHDCRRRGWMYPSPADPPEAVRPHGWLCSSGLGCSL